MFKLVVIIALLANYAYSSNKTENYKIVGKVLNGYYPLFFELSDLYEFEKFAQKNIDISNYIDKKVEEGRICILKPNKYFYGLIVENNIEIALLYEHKNKKCSGFTYSYYLAEIENIEISEKGSDVDLNKLMTERKNYNKNLYKYDLEVMLKTLQDEIAKQLPQRLDNITVLSNVFTFNNTISLIYIIRASEQDQKNIKKNIDKTKETTANSICSNQTTKILLDKGATFNYVYKNNSGKELFNYSLKKFDCK